ncbi:MAG: hypothetical protein NXH75_17710, partial [Halobacteriovoraceae bacterium]|nr:hypothetical protein [Halobacteriovoraceae bacterium]
VTTGGTGGNGQDNGSGVADDGGCGGAGSGGAVWFQAGGNIINAGTVSALGGSATACNAGNLQGGAGGSGGSGRIRLDDDDGVIANTGTINPAANTNAVSVTTSGTSNQTRRNYEGDLACGSVSLSKNGSSGGPGSSLFGLTLILGFLLTFSLKRKFPSKA